MSASSITIELTREESAVMALALSAMVIRVMPDNPAVLALLDIKIPVGDHTPEGLVDTATQVLGKMAEAAEEAMTS